MDVPNFHLDLLFLGFAGIAGLSANVASTRDRHLKSFL